MQYATHLSKNTLYISRRLNPEDLTARKVQKIEGGVSTTIEKYREGNKNQRVKIRGELKYSDGSHLVGRAKQLNVCSLFAAKPPRLSDKLQFTGDGGTLGYLTIR